MKSFLQLFDRSFGYSRALFAAILGAVMVIWPGTAVRTIIILIGAILILIGAVSLLFSKKPEGEQNRSLLSLNGIATLVFGVVLALFPSFFAGIIMFLFGAILLIVGISEIANLVAVRRETDAPMALFAGPLITTACGVVIFFNPFSTIEWLFIFFGISLLVYAVTEIISTKKIRKIYHQFTAEKKDKNELIEDVEYEEVGKN